MSSEMETALHPLAGRAHYSDEARLVLQQLEMRLAGVDAQRS